MLDALPDQPAGAPPNPSAGFESADGNYVVVDIGNGMTAFYGNLQPGSLTVQVGDRVQRREVLGHARQQRRQLGAASATSG